jgi:hypothetical protein
MSEYLYYRNWGLLGPRHDGTIADVLADLKKNTSVKKLIIMTAEEVYLEKIHIVNDEYNEFNNYCNINNIEKHLIVHLSDFSKYPDHLSRDFQIVGWPTYFLNHSNYRLLMFNNNYRNKIKREATITTPFICLNNKAHPHRCMMIDTLAKHNLIEVGTVSWHNNRYHSDNYHFRYWQNPRTLELNDGFNKNEWWSSQWIPPSEFYSSLVSLVTETNCHSNFLTEKIFMCILLKQPFIILGCRGIHNHLESFGFKLYHELVDYSFDNEIELETRCEFIVKNLKNIIDIDYNRARKSLNDIIEFNFNRANEILDNNLYIPKIILECPKNFL